MAGKQFEQWTGYAFHIRRRLTFDEQKLIGDAIDCRGTEEGVRRFKAIKDVLPDRAIVLAVEELGLTRIPA